MSAAFSPVGKVFLREDLMPAAGINQAQRAKALGVSRLTISEIVLEKRGVSPDLTIRLAKYFGTSPELWIGLQKDVDLWDAMQMNRNVYDRIKPLKGKIASCSPKNIADLRQAVK